MRRALLAAALALAPGLAQAGPEAEGAAAALANPVAALTLEALSATRERPLFSPARRLPPPPEAPPPAPPPPAAEAPAPPSPPAVALLGIVSDPDGARAIVRAEAGNGIQRLAVGDTIGGWQVAEIGRTELVLKLGEQVETIALFAPRAGKRTRTVVVPPAPMKVAPMKVAPVLRSTPKNFESDGL